MVCPATWRYPLSSADPEVQAKGVAALKTALTAAAMWRAEDVVITPAVVDETTPPSAAWSRSQAVLRDQILPLAGGFKVHVAIEVPTEQVHPQPRGLQPLHRRAAIAVDPGSLRVCEASGAGIVGTPPEWIRTLARRLTRASIERPPSGSRRRHRGAP